MNIHNSLTLEDFWENLLSRDPKLIREVIDRIGKVEKSQVIDHLQKMAEEPGWHEEQKVSARCALDVILHD